LAGKEEGGKNKEMKLVEKKRLSPHNRRERADDWRFYNKGGVGARLCSPKEEKTGSDIIR